MNDTYNHEEYYDQGANEGADSTRDGSELSFFIEV